MNEDFRNGFENPEEKKADIPSFEAEINDVPSVDAEVVDEPKAAPENPVYQQNYGSQSYSGYNNYSAQSYYQPAAPAKKTGMTKGMKAFVACIAVAIVFALGFGAASIVKSVDKSTTSDEKIVNEDLPEVNINSSPVTPTNISSGGVLTAAQVHAKLSPSNVGIVV